MRFVGLVLVLLTTACSSLAEEVTIQFAAVVGNESFACGQTYPGLGSSNSNVTPIDWRFFVHDVALLVDEESGSPMQLEENDWQVDEIALLDFAGNQDGCSSSAEMRTELTGFIVPRDYQGIRFTVGVPFSRNHDDVAFAPGPLSVTSMWWNWNDGYKFIRIDGPAGELDNWRFHLGSTECEGDFMGNVTTCANPNRVEVTLMGFDPTTTPITMDLAGLLSSIDLTQNTADTPEGCMGSLTDPDCAAYFTNLGLGETTADQVVFRPLP